MKQRYHLISSILSLVLTAILLVCICFAWFISNKEVSVTGISVSSSDGALYDISLTRYKAIEDGDIYNIDYNTTQIDPFDILNPYSKVIYEIKFKTDVLDFDTLDMFLQTTTSTDIPGLIYDGTSYYNYLSNVCSFSWLTKVTDGFSIDENCSNIGFSFENDTIRQTTVLVKENMTSLSLFQSNGYYYIYLLFDYDTIKINRIFSYNIGFTGNKIYFKEDVSFIIKM